jgi:hypothetical protein
LASYLLSYEEATCAKWRDIRDSTIATKTSHTGLK